MYAQCEPRKDLGPFHGRRMLSRAFGALGALATALSLMGVSSAQKGPPVWRDDFDGALDVAWSWLHENSDGWTLTEQPGYLRIRATPLVTGGENLLLRTGAEGNFSIETRLLFEPQTNFQFAGLVIFQDEANYLQFGRAFCDVEGVCVGAGLYFDQIRDGGLEGSNYATPWEPGEVFLRLELDGDRLTAFYGGDGQTWHELGQHELPAHFEVRGVGLTASQNYSGEDSSADIDYFSLAGNPKPSSPFVGHWEAVDVDASAIRLTIGGPLDGPFHITWTEDYISYCGGEAGIVRGTGQPSLDDPRVLEAGLHLECFTTGASLDFSFAWRYDPLTDSLSGGDPTGALITWHRPGHPAPAPDLYLRVNYGHDWVESFYEAGHAVRVTITDADGAIKATAQVYTQPREEWGGEPGFQTQPSDWQPAPPDIQPADRVRAVLETGQTSEVQIGDIQGDIDLEADTVSGTIAIPGFSGSEQVQVQCMPWGAPVPPEDTYTAVVPNGSDEYTCSWPPGAWDIQPGQDVGVAYFTVDGHWVANAFFITMPTFVAYVPGAVEGYDWPLGDMISLDVNGGEYFATAESEQRPDSPEGETRVLFELWRDGFAIEAGDHIVMTDGPLAKQTVVTSLAVTDFDLEAGTVSGIFDPASSLWVWLYGEDGQVPATEGDTWVATFAELPLGAMGGAVQNEEDGDGTSIDFVVPEHWIWAYTYDRGTWTDGQHEYSFDMTSDAGTGSIGPRTFTVSDAVDGHDGFALLDPWSTQVREGEGCTPADAIHPSQETRFRWGWATDDPLTYEEALALYESMQVTVSWDGGDPVPMNRRELLQADEVNWADYTCSLTSP